MAGVFGFSSDTDVERRKTTVTYGKLSRPIGRLAQAQSNGEGKLPSKTSKTTDNGAGRDMQSQKTKLSAVRQKTQKQSPISTRKADPRPERDEWDMSSEEETPRAKKNIKTAKQGKKMASNTASPLKHKAIHGSSTEESSPHARKRKRGDVAVSTKTSPTSTRPSAVIAVQVTSPTKSSAITSRRTSASSTVRALPSGRSAPARLVDMVAETSLNSVRKPITSPQRSQRSDPSEGLQTPPRQRDRPPPSLKKAVSLTPKQNRLWTQLLDPSDADIRPIRSSTLHFGALLPSNSGQEKPSSPAAGPSRQRLADRLKQDSQLTLDDSASDEDMSDGSVTATPSQDINVSSSFMSQNLESTATKHTYSQSRSFLQENLSFEDSLSQPLLSDVPDLKGKFQSELDLEMEDEMQTGLRTVHELRAAGSRTRFVDDLEAIMDDIKEHSRGSWSRRRSALMELFQKLIGTDYTTRFVESSYSMTLTKEFTTHDPPDQIADTILYAIICNLTYRDLPLHFVDGLRKPVVIAWLVKALGQDRKVAVLAKDRTNNMSKMSQESYLDFMETVKHALLWQGASPHTMGTEVLALKALQGVLIKTRKTGQRHPVLTERPQVQKLIEHIRWNKASDVDAGFKQKLAFEVLEAESLSMTLQSPGSSLTWTPSTVQELLVPFAAMLFGTSGESEDLAAYLRLLLNVTNNQPANCTAFTHTPSAVADLFTYIANGFDKVTDAETDLDLLLLSLGLAINLAEHSDAVRHRIPPSTLSALTQTFVRGEESSSQAASIEQSRANVAYGYLAILLANSCLSFEAKATVRSQLPGADMSMLVRSVEEFLGYHRRVDKGEQLDEESMAARDEAWTGFTERLGAVVEKLRS